ncbi:MAG: putative LPS assembly protein LptD [Bacteroidota bacterium]|nr:putative LPS assembly protein LptD [Bacteroidota bacterium]
MLITFGIQNSYGQFWKRKSTKIGADSTQLKSKLVLNDSSFVSDSSISIKDTVEKKKEPQRDVETTIKYEAEDSIVIDAEDRTAFLYRKAQVEYGKKKMNAHVLNMDYKTNTVESKYGEDTLGNKFDIPIFDENGEKYEAHEIKYNYKSKRGRVKNIITKQGEGVVHGQLVKTEPDKVMFVEGAAYTTCDLRDPHYSIKAVKIKFIPGKKIVTRAFNLQIHDIPTIIAFPFAIFPFSKKRSSGILVPSYADNVSMGFGLINGGFFWATNPYIGMALTGDFYTNGGSILRYNLDYKSRYSFNGKFSYENNDTYLSKDNPNNQGKLSSFRVLWSHSTTSKTSGRLSASVNIFTNNFNQNQPTGDPMARQTGQAQSSVNYSNEIRKTPFNYSLSARQSQDNRGKMDFNLPDASINMRQIYPLRNVPFINKVDWVKKLNFRITTSFTNNFSNVQQNVNPGYYVYGVASEPLTTINGFGQYISNIPNFGTDTSFSKAAIKNYYKIDTLNFNQMLSRIVPISNWKAVHTIPVATSIRIFKYFNLNPGFNFTETWYKQSYKFEDWNEKNRSVKIDTLVSFQNALMQRQYSWNTSLGLTTNIYGTFYIKRWNMEAIRHTVRPTISFSYAPDLSNQNFDRTDRRTRINEANDSVYFNKFTGARTKTLNGLKDQRALSFGVVNQFELKVRDKKDTTKIAYKKIMLLDNVSINSSYNFAMDSFNLSNIAIAARTRILIFDINFSTSIDPYYYQSRGITTTPGVAGYVKYQRRDLFDWNTPTQGPNGESININNKQSFNRAGGIGKLQNFNLSIAATFKPKSSAKRKIEPLADGTDLQFMRSQYPPFVDWSLPWSLNVNYVATYTRFSSAEGFIIEKSVLSNNITLRGDISVTEKWKISGYSGLNILPESTEISNTGLSILRDLHCWQASINWQRNPRFGDTFIATIGIKAATLKDVKLDRRVNPPN